MICPRCFKSLNIGDWPYCPHSKVEGSMMIRWGKAMVLRNPRTGEVRVPGRTDRAINPKHIQQGFTEQVTIDSGRDMINFEKKTGLVHEDSSYNNSGLAEKDTGCV